MANISSASGKITLKGDWTQEAIAALELVLLSLIHISFLMAVPQGCFQIS